MYQEREINPRRPDAPFRSGLLLAFISFAQNRILYQTAYALSINMISYFPGKGLY
jgi:hypothetical protein